MSTGTIRIKHANPEDNDGSSRQTIVGEMGYQWHLGPNETKVMPDNVTSRQMASNATVKFGTTVQQAVAPKVIADVDDEGGIS